MCKVVEMVFSWSERYFQVTFLNFLARFLSFLGLQEAETRKFELQAPAGGEQFNLPRFTASSRPRKVKNRGQKGHKSHEKQRTDQEDAFLVKWCSCRARPCHSLFNSQVFFNSVIFELNPWSYLHI